MRGMLLFVQKDGTYMFNLDAFIVKLCNLAQEVGDDDAKVQLLRAAGLQVLSSMVIRMLLGHMLLTVLRSFHYRFIFQYTKLDEVVKEEVMQR